MRALLFDFNGTLSDDEGLQCEIYQRLFAEQGKPLTEEQYFAELAGLSDVEIVERWLGAGHPAAAAVLAARVRLYQEAAADGSTVAAEVREAVRSARGRARLAVVSGAMRSEVESVLRAAGLDFFDEVVVAADVGRGKPAPDIYLRALELLQVDAAEAVAIEDAAPGVASAKAAGLYVVGVAGTASADRLEFADEVVPRLDVELVNRLLSL